MYLDFDGKIKQYNKEVSDRSSWTEIQKKSAPIQISQFEVIGDLFHTSIECFEVFENSLAQFYSNEPEFERSLMLFIKIEGQDSYHLRKGDTLFIEGKILDVFLHNEKTAFPGGVLKKINSGIFPGKLFNGNSISGRIPGSIDRFTLGSLKVRHKDNYIDNGGGILFFRRPNNYTGKTEFDNPPLRKEIASIFS